MSQHPLSATLDWERWRSSTAAVCHSQSHTAFNNLYQAASAAIKIHHMGCTGKVHRRRSFKQGWLWSCELLSRTTSLMSSVLPADMLKTNPAVARIFVYAPDKEFHFSWGHRLTTMVKTQFASKHRLKDPQHTVPLLNIEPLGSEFDGRNTWK
jgi:hypothetical protein